MLSYIVVVATLVLMGAGGPFFIKKAYGEAQMWIFLVVYAIFVPGILLVLFSTSSGMGWLAVVGVIEMLGGAYTVRYIAEKNGWRRG